MIQSKINKILIIRFSSLGDMVLLSCLIQQTKTLFPTAQIDLLTKKDFANLYQDCPHISNIIAASTRPSITSWLKLGQKLRSNKYDLVLDAHGSLRSLIIRILLTAVFKNNCITIKKQRWQRWLLLKYKKTDSCQLMTRRALYLQLLAKFQLQPALNTPTKLYIGKTISNKLAKQYPQLLGNKHLIAIAPGASTVLKKWPYQYYYQLAKLIPEKWYFVLLGAANEQEPAQINELLSSRSINLAGQLSPIESACLLQYCQVAITNDSAVAHIAEAVNTPVLMIFGATVSQLGFGPYLPQSRSIEISLHCRPCTKNGRGKCYNPNKYQCLTDLTPHQVFNNLTQIIR